VHVAVLATLVDLGDDVLRAPLAARDEERPCDAHRVAEGLAGAEEGDAPEGPEQHGRAPVLGEGADAADGRQRHGDAQQLRVRHAAQRRGRAARGAPAAVGGGGGSSGRCGRRREGRPAGEEQQQRGQQQALDGAYHGRHRRGLPKLRKDAAHDAGLRSGRF
jgi:hypothetical protein